MTDRNSVLIDREEAARLMLCLGNGYFEGAKLAQAIRALRTPVEPVLPGGEAVGTSSPSPEQGIREAAFLVALAGVGIPPDVQELLTVGNPMMGIKPGALRHALSSVGRGGGGK